MVEYAKIFLIICLFCALPKESTQRSVEFRNIRIKFNPKYFNKISAIINNNSMDVVVDIAKTLVRGHRGLLDFKIRTTNAKTYRSLYRHDIDVCTIAEAARLNIFKKWYNTFLKYGNFSAKCPVIAGNYYLKKWQLGDNLLPTILYPGEYRVSGYAYYGKYKSENEEFLCECELDAIIN